MAVYFSFPLFCTGGFYAARATTSGRSFNLILYILFIVAFIYFTYYVTKTVGTRLTGGGQTGSRNAVKLVESTMLGPERRVSIIEVAGVHYIVYADKNGSTLLDKRTDLSEILESNRNQQVNTPFSKIATDLSFKKTFDYILKKNRDEND